MDLKGRNERKSGRWKTSAVLELVTLSYLSLDDLWIAILMPFESKILQLLSLKMSSLPWSYMWKFLNAFQSRAGKNLAVWKRAYVGICHIDIQQIIIRIAQLHLREGSAEKKPFSSLLLQLIDFFFYTHPRNISNIIFVWVHYTKCLTVLQIEAPTLKKKKKSFMTSQGRKNISWSSSATVILHVLI